ncbi:type II toxin-antitoxin system Phd/YefM family antitoxin [Patescibacteria group bacterium]|nr:type II toxin-antitoxin system Phd/YefM family antitoxin [Patescibacteria group bacterium]MBU1124171.1 type II toxin-antitoxin system Phd/YefM family antitoxin [Patescibacteria group bacterium]MBU1911856.1 type II toxin-antitoxin system Phd/YefM family antitoxin [Patescibacteria group bacterium]
MDSIFPIITVTQLRKETKEVIDSLKDYVVVQNHGEDVAVILSPDLGKVLLQSGVLRDLIAKCSNTKGHKKAASKSGIDFEEFDQLIGQVIRELSKE